MRPIDCKGPATGRARPPHPINDGRAQTRLMATTSTPPSGEVVSRAATAAADQASRALDAAARAAQTGTVPTHVAARRGRDATLVALAGLAGFGLIFAAVKARRSEAIDLALTLRLQRGRRPWLDRLMAGVSWPGFPP